MSTSKEKREPKTSIVLTVNEDGFTIKQRLASKILKTFTHKTGQRINWDALDEFPFEISFLLAGGKEVMKAIQKQKAKDGSKNEE